MAARPAKFSEESSTREECIEHIKKQNTVIRKQKEKLDETKTKLQEAEAARDEAVDAPGKEEHENQMRELLEGRIGEMEKWYQSELKRLRESDEDLINKLDNPLAGEDGGGEAEGCRPSVALVQRVAMLEVEMAKAEKALRDSAHRQAEANTQVEQQQNGVLQSAVEAKASAEKIEHLTREIGEWKDKFEKNDKLARTEAGKGRQIIDQLKAKHELAAKSLEEAHVKNEHLAQTIDALKADKVALMRELETGREEQSALEESKSKERSQIGEMAARVEHAKKQLALKEVEIKNLKEEVEMKKDMDRKIIKNLQAESRTKQLALEQQLGEASDLLAERNKRIQELEQVSTSHQAPNKLVPATGSAAPAMQQKYAKQLRQCEGKAQCILSKISIHIPPAKSDPSVSGTEMSQRPLADECDSKHLEDLMSEISEAVEQLACRVERDDSVSDASTPDSVGPEKRDLFSRICCCFGGTRRKHGREYSAVSSLSADEGADEG